MQRASSNGSTTDSGAEKLKESSVDETGTELGKDEATTLDSGQDLDRNFSTVSDSSDCRFNRTQKAWAFVAIYEEREV